MSVADGFVHVHPLHCRNRGWVVESAVFGKVEERPESALKNEIDDNDRIAAAQADELQQLVYLAVVLVFVEEQFPVAHEPPYVETQVVLDPLKYVFAFLEGLKFFSVFLRFHRVEFLPNAC
jgi:hypothetical protein